MWRDCASLQFSPCPMDLIVLCLYPGTHLRGGQCPSGREELVPWPPRAQWRAPHTLWEVSEFKKAFSPSREACRSRSCQTTDMSFSDPLRYQGWFRLHIWELKVGAVVAAQTGRPVTLKDERNPDSMCPQSWFTGEERSLGLFYKRLFSGRDRD